MDKKHIYIYICMRDCYSSVVVVVGGGGGAFVFPHHVLRILAEESLQTGCSLVADHVVAMKDEVRTPGLRGFVVLWLMILSLVVNFTRKHSYMGDRWWPSILQGFIIVGAILKSVLYFFQSPLQPRSEK